MKLHASVLVLASAAAAGCVSSSLGPRTVAPAGFDYNRAISRVWDEQLLLNLVRLRYRDSPLFVDVNSVTASYSLRRGAALAASAGGGDPRSVSAAVNLGFDENPVISYGYLRGDQFAQRLLSPLSPTDLTVLAQSGWSVERLLLCCYQSVNGLENAVAASGPTPDYVPKFEPFQRVASLIRQLQLAGQLGWDFEPDGHNFLHLAREAGPQGEELRRLLSLDAEAERFELVRDQPARQPTQIVARARSLLGVMYFLSLAVDVPAAHRAAGRVTRTHDAAGNDFDWTRVVGRLMAIHSGPSAPPETAVQVAVRGQWFWIADDDLNSKTTFSLLRLLFFLKSGDSQGPSPLVTIPAR